MWIFWILLGMFMGWLTIGLLIPYLRAQSARMVKRWTEELEEPKVRKVKTAPIPKTEPTPEPTINHGAFQFDNEEDFAQWREKHNAKVEEEVT